MLDIKLIRDKTDLVRRSIEERGLDPARVDVERLLAVDVEWRQVQGRADELRNQRNEISSAMKKLAEAERPAAIERVKALKRDLAEIELGLDALREEREALLLRVPNLLADDAPRGRSDEDNVEISRWGSPPELGFAPRDHVELGRLTDTIDFDRAAKVTGSSFYFLKREAALLEQALCSFAASRLLPRGFVPVSTPDIARDQVLEGIGFAPRGPETQVYSLEGLDLSLVGTAEITMGGYHGGEVIEAERLPLRYVGFSHCFRTEAGAYGKESRGLYRVHQFTKAEMFVLCAPESSEQLHQEILELEQEIWQSLGIAHRVVSVCSGELGAPAVKKYDIEAWMPGRSAFGEVTSCSNCTDYQARRLNIRYRTEAKASPRFLHMLNGTALAVSRALIALFENYQREDGSIRVPEVLAPWMHGIEVIPSRA